MTRPLLQFVGIFSISILLFSSCEMIDPEPAVVPGYVYVPSVSFVTDPAKEGSNTNKFVDVWLYNDGILLGNIGVPALIPVQRSGATKIIAQAGIMKSGQDDWRVAYPLMQSYQITVDLKPNQVDTIYPVFKYLPTAKFEFIEDFERNGFQFTYNPNYRMNGDSVIKVHDPRVADSVDQKVGKLVISPASTIFQIYTTDEYVLPGYNAPVYLEVNYNTDVPLQVGYYYQSPNQPASGDNPVLQLNPTGGWNTIYVNLTDEVSNKTPGTRFKIYIGMFKGEGQEASTYIDNIKLIDLP